ncbi:MAG: thiamine phosphate synthase [Bacteroidales bacterium]|jgi:thiamine-phosphate pyrophosphorylase|nr:thiamine phosphate synthase [Bacteroidales bacterium]MDD3161837.1 thiamine phosphate synthase [Bacteroidales bacterium]
MKGLLFITHQTEHITTLQSVAIALAGGCRHIQLRMKEATTDEVVQTAIRAQELCTNAQANLYINDHPAIAAQVGAAGVHLGKSDMSPREARRILPHGSIIGGTANTFDDILYLAAQGVDYIGLGPFRFTETKSVLSPTLGIVGYHRLMCQCQEHHIHLPLFAIGSITYEDIPAVIAAGMSGVAISSAILRATDPIAETKRIIHLLHTYTQ